MRSVCLALFPPVGGTFENFDKEEFEQMIIHVSQVITHFDTPERLCVTVFAQGEETIPEMQPEYEGGPPHSLFPTLEKVRKYRRAFPCHLDACYVSSQADAKKEAQQYARAQSAGGLILLSEWRKFSTFQLTCHMTYHLRIDANDRMSFRVTSADKAGVSVATV